MEKYIYVTEDIKCAFGAILIHKGTIGLVIVDKTDEVKFESVSGNKHWILKSKVGFDKPEECKIRFEKGIKNIKYALD